MSQKQKYPGIRGLRANGMHARSASHQYGRRSGYMFLARQVAVAFWVQFSSINIESSPGRSFQTTAESVLFQVLLNMNC